MKKINFREQVLPHLIAVAIFFIVTLFFFSPFFFEHKVLSQQDIQQVSGLAKSLADYREATGKEGLWAASTFSGMPAYLVSMKWGNGALMILQNVFTLFISHPVNNIFAAFLCYYILLLAFGVRPSLAIAGALAFGLSTYIIIGLGAGHNGRIGAIAYMPLVIAGIHLVFTNRRIIGFSTTAMALAFHLRQNHLQITYYFLFVIGLYVIIQLIIAVRNKQLPDYAKNIALLIPAALLALGTFFGQFWAITEYSPYSVRGASELRVPGAKTVASGVDKNWAFSYKYGIWEPMTLLVPNFYGGSASQYFGQDQKSDSYKALVQIAQNGDEKTANQLLNYTRAYWGPGTGGAYYSGAIIVFLFVLGMLLADKKYIWWLVPVSVLSLMLSWGDSFSGFNYFMFDYFPGYNKFRSFSFALVIIVFAMPLLGFIGLEKLFQTGINKDTKRKLLIAFAATGGLSLVLCVFGGMGSFMAANENQLPVPFLNALISDRQSLFQTDAFRSFAFIAVVFAILYFDLPRKVSLTGFFALLIVLVIIDLSVVDRRYFTKANYQRSQQAAFNPTPADEVILRDKSFYRVFDLSGGTPMADARPSYFHNSLGGYHGAKMRRYQDLYDSSVVRDIQKLDQDLRGNTLNFSQYKTLNMLNTRYIVLGPDANAVFQNPAAYGNAWFVKDVVAVNSPTEELKKLNEINPRATAVVDVSKFKIGATAYDSAARINLTSQSLPVMKYESQSSVAGLAVFSEIYYAKGWKATIDGKDVPILRADYVLRALEIPAGKHEIEFKFEPKPYLIGNTITTASSWLMILVVLGSVVYSVRKKGE